MITFCAKQNKKNRQKPLPIEVTQGDNSNGGDKACQQIILLEQKPLADHLWIPIT